MDMKKEIILNNYYSFRINEFKAELSQRTENYYEPYVDSYFKEFKNAGFDYSYSDEIISNIRKEFRVFSYDEIANYIELRA